MLQPTLPQANQSLDENRAKQIKSDALRVISEWPTLAESHRTYMRYMINITPKADLVKGRGLIHMRAGYISRQTGIPPATLNLVERQLSGRTPHSTRKGTTPRLIERKTGRRGERYDREGLGISIAPFLRQLPSLLKQLKADQMARKNSSDLYRQVKKARAEIFQIIDTLPHRIQTRFLNYIARNWTKRPCSASYDALKRHLEGLSRLLCSITRISGRVLSSKNISDRSLTDPRPYTDITTCKTCSAGEKNRGENSCDISHETPKNLRNDEEDAYRLAKRQAIPTSRRPREYINGNDLRKLASADMQYHMDAAETCESVDLGQIAQMRAMEIGVSRPVADRLIARCGPSTAFLAVLLADQNRHNIKKPVRNPSALLNWMIGAFERGQLNLSRGLADLSWRIKQGHIRNPNTLSDNNLGYLEAAT